MRCITDSQIAALLDYRGTADILMRALGDLADGRAAVHARQRSGSGHATLNTMGAVWSAENVSGVKIYPTFSTRGGIVLVLFDLDTDAPVATLEGLELTRVRTAALTAQVATEAAAPNARVLALFGVGRQGFAHAEAIAERFDLEEIRFVDPRADDFTRQRLQRATGVPVRRTSAREAVSGADLVVTATTASRPVFDGAWLKDRAFVAAIGSETPDCRELDDTTMERAERILVEWRPQSLVEAGDIVQWAGHVRCDKIVDLLELHRGECPWRLGGRGITVFKSVGIGLLDVAAAQLAMHRARAGWMLRDEPDIAACARR